MEGMIYKFLNASTFDGYNPYRVTKGGFDWETIEPDDPWSYIGYWGDHQLIYLLKFLEFAADYFPDLLPGLLDKACFVYANVPYKIKPYREILKSPKETIDFDFELDEKIRESRAEMGADGALLNDAKGTILRVNFTEKILAVILAKLSNFIPEGGIWMNTQRPEWNDANNALVGNGVSMVTLYYLRRFLHFLKNLLAQTELKNVPVSAELADFYAKTADVLFQMLPLLRGKIADQERKSIVDQLGEAASAFRWNVYQQAFSGAQIEISFDSLRHFVDAAQQCIEHSILANERPDHLYHGYNLVAPDTMSIAHLNEMLEGQVAALSAGYLSAASSLQLLDALKASPLYRPDQQSYLLYPNKNLPGFLQKNTVTEAQLSQSGILKRLSGRDFSAILERDAHGDYHFNGNFKNANDLAAALESNNQLEPELKTALLQLFESVFQHKAFTGRSGTFFG
ncbi:MAG: hypothetical protein JNK89_00850, partial [Saprospiraceae bacterium]|nr:hypothetical protein [Saprospiraceae bacterium]